MTGFGAFLGKEAREIVRTWRIWVVPGLVLLMAVSGPIMAYFTPAILKWALQGSEAQFDLPDPTYVDSYMQWTQNLSQLVTFALVIVLGGIISSEVRQGTALMVLTRPLSRAAFVTAKVLVNVVFLILVVVVGAAVTFGLTVALFPGAPAGPVAAATGMWLVWAVVLVALMALLSAALSSGAAASGIALGFYIAVSLVGIWPPASRYSPAGLITSMSPLAASQSVEVVWPIVTGLMLAAALVAGAVWVFSRREL